MTIYKYTANWRLVDYIGLIGYGQSNWLSHLTTAASPAAAVEGTEYWDGEQWATPPAANGVRNLLNAITTATGLPSRIVSGGVIGSHIAGLQSGSAGFTDLADQIAASGIQAQYILFHQGEGDADQGTSQAAYLALLSTLHGDIVDLMGLSKAQCPLILSSLATRTSGGTDAGMVTIRNAHAAAPSELEHVYYSHSNQDAPLGGDGLHWTAAGFGASGLRYAQTVLVLRGDETDAPAWFATAAERHSTTETDVTVTHSMGTDFTPTADITGFEVSGDNGANWETPSAADRVNATTIRLTHSDLGTVRRLVRYQWSKDPDVSDPVLDNGALTSPLNFTVDNLAAEGAVAYPVPTYTGVAAGSHQGSNLWRASAVPIGTAYSSRRVIVCLSGSGGATGNITSVLIGGVTATELFDDTPETTDNYSAWYTAVVPTGTTANVDAQFSAALFAGFRCLAWTVDDDLLLSSTPVDSDKFGSASAGATTATLNLSTSAGGFVLVAATKNGTSGTLAVSSSDETYAERLNSNSGFVTVAADCSNTADATDASEITLTMGATGYRVAMSAVSFR